MDARTKLRLLVGPVRPFILSKVRDALVRPLKLRSARAQLQRGVAADLELRSHVYPLPSSEPDLAYAHAMADGFFNAFGAERWDRDRFAIEAPDPRTTIELARCHQMTAYALAEAHDHTRDWFAEFERELRSFITNHPPLTGPMWAVGMDTGIRLFNIVVAWDWFTQQGRRSDAVDALVKKTAAEHHVALMATLETSGGMGTSHLLGGLLGQIVHASFVRRPTSTGVRRPTSDVLIAFEREVDRQILDDGMSFEASTGYHRQVVDILVQAEVLIRNTPELMSAASPKLFERIAKAVDALQELERAGMPLVGDNDDGVVVKGARVQVKGERVKGWKGGRELVAFEKFGLWIWHVDDAVLTARNGPVGQYGKGGHAHNDQNSITLSVGGEQVIVDPGSYCYMMDPVRRNIDRSTAVHATVDVGVEQAWWPEDAGEGLFWLLENRTQSAVDVATATSWRGRIKTHTRSMEIGKREITVIDTVDGDQQLATISFPLGPNVQVSFAGNTAHLTVNDSVVELRWSDADASIVPLNIAPAYLVSVPTQRLVLRMLTMSAEWTIRW